MIVKLDLTGKQYHALLGALQHDANFYKRPTLRGGGHDLTAFATVLSANAEPQGSVLRSLPMHKVSLEILEHQQIPTDGPDKDGEKTPRAILDIIFDAIGLYPRS